MSNKNLKVKIFATYWKKWDIIENDIITPIQCGRAISDVQLSMQGDNTGDNISHKNYLYHELTAQYWAWKNDNDYDYIGFMHFKRHFNFGDTQKTHPVFTDLPETHHETRDDSKVFIHNYMTEEYLNKIAIDEEHIQEMLNGCDVLLPKAEDITTYKHLTKNSYAFPHVRSEKISQKWLLEIIEENFSEYVDAGKEYLNSQDYYTKNMFIMKKELFMEYSHFLFTILSQIEKRMDFTKLTPLDGRFISIMGEILLGIFILKHKNYLIKKEVQRSLVLESFTINYELSKLTYDSNTMNICLAFTSNYMGYSYVTIKSLLIHKNPNDAINIFCFIDEVENHKSTQYEYLNQLANMYAHTKIIIVNMTRYLLDKQIKLNILHTAHNISSFMRLFIPIILPKLEKVIYLDSDIFVNADIRELYDYDLKGKPVGAVRDLYFAYSVQEIHVYSDETKVYDLYTNYVKDYLQIDMKDYINTGVLLMDYNQLREKGLIDESMDLVTNRYFAILDQDLYNIVFNKKIEYISHQWNSIERNQTSNKLSKFYRPILPFQEYQENFIKEPKIIHYTAYPKLWNTIDINSHEVTLWWEIARTTPFYEYFMQNIMLQMQKQSSDK